MCPVANNNINNKDIFLKCTPWTLKVNLDLYLADEGMIPRNYLNNYDINMISKQVW
jgi:hypothetical protein